MKTKLFKTLTLALCTIAYSITTNAQFPDFTRVDTGSIYESQGSLAHFSGILFDIDNDGDLDPVISSENAIGSPSSPLALYRNERKGVYKQEVLLPVYSNAFDVSWPSPMGDIDNDGDIDVIASNSFQLGVFVNDGYGNFLSDTSFDIQNSFNSIYPVLLDYNKDGHLDLLYFSSSVKVFYNDGNGNFLDGVTLTNINRPETDWLHSMAWGDADNDGDMDVYCGFSKGVAINAFFINTGDSLKSVDQNHITLSDTSMTGSVNWVDYDNDGDMDLCVKPADPDTINGLLPALYENLGNLEFEKHILLDESYKGSFTISSYWGDLDNDGDQDLFLSLEDGPWPFSGPYKGQYSPTLYNILYLNDGNGQFTNLLNHTLSLGEGHTAKLFDHDNDGDLDVLTIGNALDIKGHNQLYINEGNDNSSISISCVDKFNCATPYGTRVYAKTMIDGEYVSQTREITLIDGNVAFTYTPVHFGLGDADVIDTLLIRWPSGLVETYLNVKANQFYRAIEDDKIEIDFKATNYIEYSPGLPDVKFTKIEESTSIDLKEYYRLITGDTVPEITGDTLTFSVYANENPAAVNTTFDGTLLTLEAGQEKGDSKVQIKASAGFTERVDHFTVKREFVDVITYTAAKDLSIYPNPFSTSTTFEYQLNNPENVRITFYNQFGKQVDMIEESQQRGLNRIEWTAKNLAGGIYYFRLQAGDQVASGKVLLVC